MSATILISDDDRSVVTITSRILTSAGYQVQSVPGGQAQDTIAACRAAPPDLLITDIQKPNTNGLAMCRALRRDPATRQIPILIASGYVQSNGEYLNASGADAFVEKPFLAAQLLRVIRDLLAAQSLGLRLNPITSVPPWPILEEQLGRFATDHTWALLKVWLEPSINLWTWSTIVCGIVDQHTDLWVAHDTRIEQLFIAGAPDSIDLVQQRLQERFATSAGNPTIPLLHQLRAGGSSGPPSELSDLFLDQRPGQLPDTPDDEDQP